MSNSHTVTPESADTERTPSLQAAISQRREQASPKVAVPTLLAQHVAMLLRAQPHAQLLTCHLLKRRMQWKQGNHHAWQPLLLALPHGPPCPVLP